MFLFELKQCLLRNKDMDKNRIKRMKGYKTEIYKRLRITARE